MVSVHQPMSELANLGSSSTQVGGLLLTTLSPSPGQEVEYVRWYEDDHYISGALAWPWVFAGRRWVSTKDLSGLRRPHASDLAGANVNISFVHTYLITDGHVGDVEEFASYSLERLNNEGRMRWDIGRSHVYTYFHDFVGAAYSRGFEPRAMHALDYPFTSIVLEVLDAPGLASRDELCRWLLEDHAPNVLGKGPAMCLVATPRPRRLSGDGARALQGIPGFSDARVTVLWLSEGDPATTFRTAFADEEERIDDGGRASDLQLLLPCRPALAGTNRYLDQL